MIKQAYNKDAFHHFRLENIFLSNGMFVFSPLKSFLFKGGKTTSLEDFNL